MSGTKTQLIIGLVTGIGASFAILQQITDRRLLAFPKPVEEDRDKDGLHYQTLLYRRMWESKQAKSSREFEAEKAVRESINSGLYATSRIINTVAELLKRKMGDKPSA